MISDQAVRVFTGSEVIVGALSAQLEQEGIPCLIQNDFNSRVMAGFSGGTPSAVDLYIN